MLQRGGVVASRSDGFHLQRVDVGTYESHTVGTYPDVALAVAGNAVDAVVGIAARHAELVADGGVPGVGALVIEHECALSVEPDVVLLVGKGIERGRLAQVLLGNEVGLPDGMLLVHDVATDDAAVLIDDEGTVAALADGGDDALRHAVVVVGIAKLVEQLLLHVVGHHTLVGNGCPEVLVAVNIHYVGAALYAHATVDLLHVALKVLALGVVDAEACRSLDPERSLQGFLDADDVAVGQRGTVLRVALEVVERVAVVAVKTGWRAQPDVASGVFEYAVNLADGQPVVCVERLEQVNAGGSYGQCQHQYQQQLSQYLHIPIIIRITIHRRSGRRYP